jgi:hypothetical protein
LRLQVQLVPLHFGEVGSLSLDDLNQFLVPMIFPHVFAAVGRCTLTPPDPLLKSAWLQIHNLSNEKTTGFKCNVRRYTAVVSPSETALLEEQRSELAELERAAEELKARSKMDPFAAFTVGLATLLSFLAFWLVLLSLTHTHTFTLFCRHKRQLMTAGVWSM